MTEKSALSVPAVAVALGLAGVASAAEILVSGDITESVTWTAGNTYNLQNQVYVKNGATLTIEPGVVVASTTNLGGSLAVTRGSKIIAIGTQEEPIIFTSKADVATWSGDAPMGVWREAANEWGNLTIMGRAYVSDSQVAGNTKTPSPNNLAIMEGLTPDFNGDPDTLYGGGDDDDDSGSLKYVSIRYGGKVIALNNELNGLSLGGIGRETDIDYVEVMNNVDDGIEIWGGTVNLKHVNVWNIGDDSFDIDQGWRGKAQFGLLVQGHSLNAAQGSGVGDNLFETDGAEGADAQPVTTGVIYNFTAIGQPAPGAGDHGTAWRDNARMQYRNCIFMDLGDRLVSFDNIDGDGGEGYGFNGTLSWAQTWTTAFNVYSVPNAPPNPADFYQAQTAGFLALIRDSVMFRNLSPNAYTTANEVNVFAPNKMNVIIPGFDDANSPIQSLSRGRPVVKGGLTMLPVTSIDPRPKNEALSTANPAPSDGFYTPANYRGAFGPDENWLCNWSAAWAFGFVVPPPGGCVIEPTCPTDLNEDGNTDAADLAILLGAWGSPTADLTGDNTTDAADLAILLGAWGGC